jgi:hypothetical protein
MDRRQLGAVALVAGVTGLVLSLLVALTFGTRWGFETYLFPYAVGAAALPLVGALATRRYRLVLPFALLPAGVLTFVAGVTWSGAYCLQGGAGDWYLAYDPARNVIRFGGSAGACNAEPNPPVVGLGYALTTLGGLQSVDAVTARAWSPLDLSVLPGLGRFARERDPDADDSAN